MPPKRPAPLAGGGQVRPQLPWLIPTRPPPQAWPDVPASPYVLPRKRGAEWRTLPKSRPLCPVAAMARRRRIAGRVAGKPPDPHDSLCWCRHSAAPSRCASEIPESTLRRVPSAGADWHRRREIIRTLVQRIDIGPEVIKIVFRVMQDARGARPESIVVTLSRA